MSDKTPTKPADEGSAATKSAGKDSAPTRPDRFDIPEEVNLIVPPDVVGAEMEITVTQPSPLELEQFFDLLIAVRQIKKPTQPLGRNNQPLPATSKQGREYARQVQQYEVAIQRVENDSALLATVYAPAPADWQPQFSSAAQQRRKRYQLPGELKLDNEVERDLAFIKHLMGQPLFGDKLTDAIEQVSGTDIDETTGLQRREVIAKYGEEAFQGDVAG